LDPKPNGILRRFSPVKNDVICGRNAIVRAHCRWYFTVADGFIWGAGVRKSLLSGVSIGALVLATGAHAADLRARPIYKTPPTPPLQPWTWTGFYVGGNIGGAEAHSSITNDPASSSPWLVGQANADRGSVIGGLQAGLNYQIYNVVLGIEGDIGWASLSRSVAALSLAGPGFDTYSSKLDTLGTVRGRVGLAFDRLLVYGTGGAAFANLKDQLVDTAAHFTASPNSSVTGWTAGGGIEYAFADHWTAKAEYLHVGFPDRTAFSSIAALGYAFTFKDSLDIGRVGINYKF
jgi:outer membrane immunogenic protein